MHIEFGTSFGERMLRFIYEVKKGKTRPPLVIFLGQEGRTSLAILRKGSCNFKGGL